MFSSQIPSSTNSLSPPNSFFDYEQDNLDFNHHQQIHNPYISNNHFCHTYSCPAHPPPDCVLQHQFSEDHDDLLESVVSSYKKKVVTSKKDGHSKICTAGRLRDRRVRLSIDISRKFFCLQDLLGFDKASKTLDWLLTKSLRAIKDLVEQTNHSSSSTVTHESIAKFLESIKGDSDEEKCKKKSILKCVDGKGKKTTQRSKGGSQENFSREQSRAEARARARERTKEKFRVKKLDGCGQTDQQNGNKDISWEFIMGQETSNKSKD